MPHRASDNPNSYVRDAARGAKKVGYTLAGELRKRGTDEELIEAIVTCSHVRAFASPEVIRRSAEARETLKAAGAKNIEAVLIAIRLDDEQRYWQEFVPVLAAWGDAVLPELNKLAHRQDPLVRRSVALAFREMQVSSLPKAPCLGEG